MIRKRIIRSTYYLILCVFKFLGRLLQMILRRSNSILQLYEELLKITWEQDVCYNKDILIYRH